ncbi:MAG: M12 family metallo-peptidase [Planctomycetota bacterium]
MMFSVTKGRVATVALGALLTVAGFATTAMAQQSTAVLPGEVITEAMVNAAFGLAECELTTLNVPTFYDGSLDVTVPFAGGRYELDLHAHSVRSDDYEVREMTPSGVYRNVAPGPILTKRGTVVGIPGSMVSASLTEGLSARVDLPGGNTFMVDPVSLEIAGAPANLHVVYHVDAVLERPDNLCGLDDDHRTATRALPELAGGPKVACAPNFWVCQVAIETDYEYYVDLGSTANIETRVNQIMNAVNVEYERDVDITHVITVIYTYPTNTDYYTSTTDPGTLLDQFRTNWNQNHRSDLRDVAHMYTGRSMAGGVIGIAWLGAICSSITSGYGYGLVENISGTSCRADLSAHEIGHNWNADHCTCTSYTMNPYLTCSNQFHPTYTIPAMINYRNLKACLSCSADVYCQLDLGFGGPGASELSICGGDMSSGTTADLVLANGVPYMTAFLRVGYIYNPTSFRGGILVPNPGVMIGPLWLDGTGGLEVLGIQGGGTAVWYVQGLSTDVSQLYGVSISNCIALQMLP